MSSVAGYVRVSTREQSDNGHGIEVQKEKIRQWAQLHDVDHIQLFEDRGESATDSGTPRPLFATAHTQTNVCVRTPMMTLSRLFLMGLMEIPRK